MKENPVTVTEWMPDFYILDDGRVRQFLFVSPEKALLVDCGFPDTPILETVQKITDAPIQLILTHTDRDHAGRLDLFDDVWVHEGDWHLIDNEKIIRHPVHEGDVFTCGPYELTAIEIPGHTYGAVAYGLNRERILISGDSVQKDGPIFMFGSHRSLPLYLESQKKLANLSDQYDVILPSHHPLPITPDYIQANLEDALLLSEGKLSGNPCPGMPCWIYQGNSSSFLYDEPDSHQEMKS